MLHRRSLTRVSLALLLLWTTPAAATDPTIGNPCTAQGSSARYDNGNNSWCNGATWQYPAYQFGSTAASCSASNAGAVQYTGGTLEACNGTSWIPIDSGMHFISTQTASASASLQFTSLPTTYNTLFLNCAGLLFATNDASLVVETGQGAGPTWNLSNYSRVDRYTTTQPTNSFAQTKTATDAIGGPVNTVLNTSPVSLKMYIDNVGSATLYKNILWFSTFVFDSPGGLWTEISGASLYTGDVNPITALRIRANSGNVSSGTCSLYGMN